MLLSEKKRTGVILLLSSHLYNHHRLFKEIPNDTNAAIRAAIDT